MTLKYSRKHSRNFFSIFFLHIPAKVGSKLYSRRWARSSEKNTLKIYFYGFFQPKNTIFVIVTSVCGTGTSIGTNPRRFYSSCKKNFLISQSVWIWERTVWAYPFFGGFSHFSHFFAYKCRIPIFDPFAYF